MRRIAIVGASLAGLRAAQALRAGGYEGELTLVGDEPHPPYNRPPLSKEMLQEGASIDDCVLPYGDLDATWLRGVAATGLDPRARELRLAGREPLRFDGLLITTGCAARPWPGTPLPAARNVFSIRTVDDSLALIEAVRHARRAVILGAGFIGCEAAGALRALGLEVALVESAPLPLRPLGPELGRVCAQLHADHGVQLRLGATVAGFEATADRIAAVRLAGGARLEADLVLVATGSAPNTAWMVGSGLEVADGIVCDATCAAGGAEGVFAAGDVARFRSRMAGGRHVRIEHWSNAAEQAACAARNLLAPPEERVDYDPVPSFWSDQHGVRIQSVGFPGLADRSELLEGDPAERRFATGFFAGERLVGAVTFDMPRRMLWYRGQVAAAAVDGAVAA